EFEARNREKRLKEGIPIEETTWARLVETAASFGVAAPQ
ncbi:Ldh family oxidoreductase, partial [Candidatus Poribacteria bacterium]|nr:Ldh family oxidoreductase [Candidatus Poribacteria bacterium]